MIALLKDSGKGNYYCSQCRMCTALKPFCAFCGSEFSNFEDMLARNYNTIYNDEIKEKVNEEAIQVRN